MLLGNNRLIRRRVIVGLLLAASLTLLTLSFREGNGGVIGGIQRTALAVTAPVSGVVHRVTQPFVDGWNWTTGLVDARQENARLKEQLKELGAREVQNQVDADQTAKLEELLNYKQSNVTSDYEQVGAAGIGQSSNPNTQTIIINVGSNDGIALNDPVIGPYKDGGGLIGRVVLVTPAAATVRLITDKDSGVTAGILGGSAKGVLLPSDANDGLLSMENVKQEDVVTQGDTVITSGYSNTGAKRNVLPSIFPRGIPVGRVTSVSQTDIGDPTKVIQVTPFVDLGDLTDVLVVKVKAG
jgi:rod shape-determining protein MreC